MDRGGEAPARWRAGLAASLVAALLCGGLIGLALLAAGSHPGKVFHGDIYRRAQVPTAQPTSPSATPAPPRRQPPPHGSQSHPIATAIMALLAFGALAGAGFGLWMWWQAFGSDIDLHRRRRLSSMELPEDVDVVAEATRVVTLREDELRRVLEEGEPRNAIVACWHRLEEVAAAAGLRRHRWETSSEFVIRLLDTVGADEGATQQLAVLFREARYSEHAMPESARARAADLLDRVLSGLREVHR